LVHRHQTIEGILHRARRPTHALDAYDLSLVLDRFNLSLLFLKGHRTTVPLSVWLSDHDPRLVHVLIVEGSYGQRHWLACKGAWLCDDCRWSRDHDDQWLLRAVYAVRPG
jgi:hypothetical protein